MRTAWQTTVFSALFFIGACSSDDSTGGGSGGSAEGAGANNGVGAGATTGAGADGSAAAAANGSGTAATANAGATDPVGAAASSSVGSGGTGTGSGGAASSTGGWTDVVGAAGACETVAVGADPIPPVLLFVIDKSGSMDRNDFPSTQGATKWEATREALTAAFGSMPAQYAVGAVFYPNDDDCFTPPGGGLPVPVAPLAPDQVTALQDAVADQQPGSYTPTQDAMAYGYEQLALASLPEAYANSPRYLVLITDGVPTRALDCAMPTTGVDSGEGIALDQYNNLVSQVAAAEQAGTDTFVIGVPGSEENHGNEDFPDEADRFVARNMLSLMAVAGGRPAAGCNQSVAPMDPQATAAPFCHFDMTQEPDFVTALTRILSEITVSVLGCTYAIPNPPNQILNPDPATFLVEYTPAATGVPEGLGYQASSACTEGWYVDGTQIQLCSGTCDRVRAQQGGGSIKIEFQCVVPQ